MRKLIPFSVLLLTLTAGCAGNPSEAHRVDAGKARGLLEQVLTSWQQGETPDAWRRKTPEVVIQDLDWQRGAKLQSFEMLGNGEAIDANLHCKVELTLEDSNKKEVSKTVTYLVGTSPVLTVFREFGP